MLEKEKFNIEYKEIYTQGIKKEVVAFINTDGGTIYIGIRDDGNVIGVENADHVMQQLANALKDSIRPDVLPFVQIDSVENEGKELVRIIVQPGTGRPYYLLDKGLKPSGVYVRKGTSCQPLSDSGIREMIIQTSGRSYEKGRSLNQNLTFFTCKREMEKRNIEFGESQMKTMHLIGEDGLYSNIALLLSDQCEHNIKLAVFQGSDKAVFKDRKEFTGSVLKQLTEVYEQIEYYNPIQARFSGLERIDTKAYPEEAVREALLNSIVHRDYSFSGSTIINVYDDRIEFVSLGGLVSGLTMDTIMLGVSQSRNPYLAAIFYRMRLIESYGTGISKIRRLYEDCEQQPIFETAPGGFRTVLFNQNLEYRKMNQSPYVVMEDIQQKELNLTEMEKGILEYVRIYGSINRAEAEKLIGLKATRTNLVLRGLHEKELLAIKGKGKSTRYYMR